VSLPRCMPELDRALDCADARCTEIWRYALRWAGEGHPDAQGRLGCTRLRMALQPPSAENGTSQSDVEFQANEVGARASVVQAF